MRKQLLVAGVLACLLLFGVVADPPRVEPAAAQTRPPDLVLIYTDDQRWDQLSFMPTVQSELVAKGVDFTKAFAVNPLCCPSRMSVLRGQYSHTTQIWRNRRTYGGFDYAKKIGAEASTIATWLQDAGYRTALMGKYMNGYSGSDLSYVPPGWDVWRAFNTDPSNVPFFNYTMSEDGSVASYGSAAEDYSTDVLARQADGFIRSTPSDQPLYLHLTPVAPHAPRTPAPRHARAACPSHPLPPSVGEADISDKPAFAQGWTWDTKWLNQSKNTWTKGCRSLLSVDDAVGTILRALEDTGRLENTVFIYAGDNGHLLGEHRYFGKTLPWEESIHIPLIVRYDAALAAPLSDDRIAANIDITATFVEAAGVVPPYALEGASLLPIVRGEDPPWRSDLLIEHFDTAGTSGFIPSYCAVRTEGAIYVRYDQDDEPRYEEHYDLVADPYQLTNLAYVDDETVQAERAALLERLRELCTVPPPNYAI